MAGTPTGKGIGVCGARPHSPSMESQGLSGLSPRLAASGGVDLFAWRGKKCLALDAPGSADMQRYFHYCPDGPSTVIGCVTEPRGKQVRRRDGAHEIAQGNTERERGTGRMAGKSLQTTGWTV